MFRLAEFRDREAIVELTSERNPGMAMPDIINTTERELKTLESDPTYRLYVADLAGEIVGFCRFYDSAGLPIHKKVFPSPSGWYAMGIVVAPSWRRQGIARFLSQARLRSLKEYGATEMYSVVDGNNQASIQMHLAFGFDEIGKAPGFLLIKFESGVGILFRKII